jgi:hypothetical protein
MKLQSSHFVCRNVFHYHDAAVLSIHLAFVLWAISALDSCQNAPPRPLRVASRGHDEPAFSDTDLVARKWGFGDGLYVSRVSDEGKPGEDAPVGPDGGAH